MNKKGNSVLFMLLRTLVNLVLLIACFAVFGVLMILLMNNFPEIAESGGISMLLTLSWFGLSIVSSFLIYNKLVKWIIVKFDLENKLDPLFVSKKTRKKREEE